MPTKSRSDSRAPYFILFLTLFSFAHISDSSPAALPLLFLVYTFLCFYTQLHSCSCRSLSSSTTTCLHLWLPQTATLPLASAPLQRLGLLPECSPLLLVPYSCLWAPFSGRSISLHCKTTMTNNDLMILSLTKLQKSQGWHMFLILLIIFPKPNTVLDKLKSATNLLNKQRFLYKNSLTHCL